MRKALLIFCILILIVFLHQVFSGRMVLPQAFSIGPITIHYYGLIMAAAVAAGFYLALKRAPLYSLNNEQAGDIFFWVVIGGFLGARIYHVILFASHYASHPADVFKVWNGGLGIYGALAGGLIALIIYSNILKLKSSIFNLLDWLTPSIIVGQIIGRFGNLFNYEAFGYPTNLPWGMFVPRAFRPIEFITSNFFHPWFFYEAIGNTIILIFLYFASKKSYAKNFPGSLFFSYILLYNILRFNLEFFRTDSVFLWNFRLNAAVSLLFFLVCLIFLFAHRRKHKHVQTP